jgi:hypothetical protein
MTKTDITARLDVTTRDALNHLERGQRIEITHQVKVGQKVWTTTTTGTVEGVERRRHGLHFRRNPDDKVFSDLIILRLPDGSLSTITVDEFTDLKRV